MISIKIYKDVRMALKDYDMIQNGDKVAVGVSGGKDSMTLLLALKHLQRYYHNNFEIEAITLTMGKGDFDVEPIKRVCNELEINYNVYETQIGEIVFDVRKEKNPCSLCANLRRGALNDYAIKLGCNKIALGHNKDDVLETFMMSTFYEGRIHTFSPVSYLSRKEITLIRPLIYVEEKDIREFVKSKGLVLVKNPCPADGYTKRQYFKEMINSMEKSKKDVKSNIFGAIKRANINGWKV